MILLAWDRSRGVRFSLGCAKLGNQPMSPVDGAMRSQDGEGSTPVVFETRCSHSANFAPGPEGGSSDCGERRTGAAGHTPDGPRDREAAPEVAPSPPQAGAKSPPPGSPSPRPEEVSRASELPPRVLLAEDNRDLQQIFARQLTLLGLEVVGVTNGRDAVELALAAHQAGNPFDLVLMDLEMPIVDGYEATRRLRDGGFSGPILALSAHSTDDYRLDIIEMGCNDCVCKPIDWDHLTDLIRRFIPGYNVPGPLLSPDN
jgi:CheY-like chemotaxis protein